MRDCPHCGKEIREEAIYCRFCRRDVAPPIWMTDLQKCPFCAEWIEPDLENCPLCNKLIHAATTPEATLKKKRADDFVSNLRQRLARSEPPPRIIPEEPEPSSDQPVQSPQPPASKMPRRAPTFKAPRATEEEIPFLRSRRLDEPRGVRPLSDFLPGEIKEEVPREVSTGALPSLFRALFVVLLIGVIGIGVIILAVGPGRTFIGQMLSPEPTKTPTPYPTNTPFIAPTLPPIADTTQIPTSDRSITPDLTCILWNEVSLEDVGRELCVYGVVKRWFAVEDIPFVAIFSEEPETFYFIDRTTTYPRVRGTCVMAVGTVELMRGTRPFIDVADTLEPCPEDIQSNP
jgi:hypothetical protein